MPQLDSCGPDDFCAPIYIRSYNGSEDYSSHALIDTGASSTLIPRHVAEALGLPVVGHVNVQTANGYIDTDVVFAEVQVGEREVVGARMIVVETGDLIAIGKDLVQQLGLLVPQYLNP